MNSLLSNPENQSIFAYLKQLLPENTKLEVFVSDPASIPDTSHLGVHPDLLDFFWSTAHGSWVGESRSIIFGMPTLVCQETGIVFGCCWGNFYFALRLPGHGEKDYVDESAHLRQKFEELEKFSIIPCLEKLKAEGWFFFSLSSGIPLKEIFTEAYQASRI